MQAVDEHSPRGAALHMLLGRTASAGDGPFAETCATDRARATLEYAPAAMAYFDRSLRCRFANRAFASWFGEHRQTLIGKPCGELLGSADEFNRPHLEGVLEGQPQEFERDIVDPAGGATRHGLTNYVPDVVDGSVRGFYVLVTDISAVKRSQLALRLSEERFRLTIDEAPIGLAVVGTDGRFLRVNRALCRIVGYSERELVGMTFQALTHPDDLETDVALAGQLARGEILRYSLAKRYIRRDGRIVDVELSGSVVRGSDGMPLHFIAQVQDITERKRSENAQQFLAELGPVLASTLDPEQILDGAVRLATRKIADFCIIDMVDVQRKRVASRAPEKQWLTDSLGAIEIDPTKPSLLAEPIRTLAPVLLHHPTEHDLAGLAQGPQHLRLLRAMEIVSLVAVPMMAGERAIGGIALIASRGSRKYEAADVQLAQELAWRTAIALENARLYAAAGQATRMRDEVLAIVAHDLRSPLSTICMQAMLLRRRAQAGTGDGATVAEAIERAAFRMRRLTDDLLDVSRMEAGRLTVARKETDARQLLADCVASLRPLVQAAAIDLRLQAAPGLPPIRADADRLCQVFENLVGNAIDFTDRDGCITLSAEVRNDELLFSVRDTGAGIVPEHLPHLFDRFWQGGSSKRRGAGLGLAIVKGIVEAHGGRIWVESTPEHGSCFLFTIPRSDRAGCLAEAPAD